MGLGYAIIWALNRVLGEIPRTEGEILALSAQYRARAQYDLSRSLLQKAIEADPGETRTVYYADLGLTEAAAGCYGAAIIAHRKSIEIMPSYMPSYYRLACLLAHSGELREANGIFSRNLPVSLDNGGTTTTATIRFARARPRS